MTRRDPFTEIEELIERMGREFEELGGTLDTPGTPPTLPGGRDVAVDLIEDDETITVLADLPGFDDDEIEVELHDDALSIAATREETTDVRVGGEEADDGDTAEADSDDAGHEVATVNDDDVRYHRRERRTRSVSRRVPLPAPVDPEGASASYDGGVLTVTLPKRSSGDDGHRIDVS
ncbi:Hsp20/alpha crystallin family protein [Halorubrum sp. DTA46]|uniref:Hsp20/alpha crystallin family protein n=1 Tax=Halorubrum sp. DTA46 TaxID=3402162 RepID=UPI003AAC309D